ncbi:MAG: hypothetical protein AAF790_05505 [Planctomycetota bacterium]
MDSRPVEPPGAPASPPPNLHGDPAETGELFFGSVARLAASLGIAESEIGVFSAVTPSAMPTEYRNLLAHTGHMTVTLEAFHGTLVDVHVLRTAPASGAADASSYAREIVLTRQSDGAVVQYGLMRLWLSGLPAAVQQEVTAQQTPLGRVLIRHGLLRDVEPLSFWRIEPSKRLRQHLGSGDNGGAADEPLYGRSAQILVEQRPTVQLLEIVRV